MAEVSNKTIIDLNPAVIVDFSIKEKALYLELINLSSVPAIDVRVMFYSKLMGLKGTKDISKLPIFQNLSYMAPFKKVSIFVDFLAPFFFYHKTEDPTNTLKFEIRFKNEAGNRFEKTITHNLNNLKDLPPNSSTSQV